MHCLFWASAELGMGAHRVFKVKQRFCFFLFFNVCKQPESTAVLGEGGRTYLVACLLKRSANTDLRIACSQNSAHH